MAFHLCAGLPKIRNICLMSVGWIVKRLGAKVFFERELQI